jgi:O-antigen ligase
MQQSVEFGALPRARQWLRPIAVPVVSEGPRTAFRLVILFLLILYSNVTVIYKELDAYRPVMVIAVAALIMMVVEISQSRQGLKLMWPEGFMLVAFLGVAFVSSFDALWARLAFERTTDIARLLLFYILLENTITSRDRLRTIMLVLVIGGMMPALGTINNYLHGVLVEHSRAAWKGLFGNPNEDAYALTLLIPIAAALSNTPRLFMRLSMWAAIGIYLLAIFVTFSRGGLLGLFAVLGLIGWKQKSSLIRTLMAVAVVGSLILIALYWNRDQGFTNITQDTTYNQRIATFKAGLLMFEANPLLGVGPGCSIVAYPLYVPKDAHCGCQDQLVIHNSFIQALSEVGFLGFVPFLILLGAALYHTWQLQKGPLSIEGAAFEIALWGFLLCSLSGGFTYTWWPYIIIGLIVAAVRIADTKTPESVNAAI